MLMAAPTGISWSSIGALTGKPTAAQMYAEVVNICGRATSLVNGYCNVPLRATVDTEMLTGPGDFRCQMQRNGRVRLQLSRPPVVSVVSGQWCPAAQFPANWTAIAGDQFRVQYPLMGVYGSSAPNGSGDGGGAVFLAPGVISWMFGREAFDIEVTYVNGWPHCSITQAATVGATSLHVDNVTGWLGATGNVYDAGSQESVTVTSVTPNTTGAITGPGTLGLSQPLSYAHPTGTIVTCLPGSVIQATIAWATSIALIRGATATTVQSLPGTQVSSGTRGPDDLIAEAKQDLATYRRVI